MAIHEGMKQVYVPADYIVYQCNVGKGRIIVVPLPLRLSKAEVRKLTAFIETQADDEPTQGGRT